MTPATHAGYDAVPYTSQPFPDSHPSRLFAVATLFGLDPPPVDRCRVLELGCAAGGNLIPVAEELPNSRFLGIDLSARQAADGQAVVRDMGLTNVEVRHASIMDVDESYGTFDYVIAHGVYSWVPAAVQEKMLEICGTRLSPNGVAYISYNVYPGWHMRGMLRDMMRYHAERFVDPAKRIEQARALLDFLAVGSKIQEGSAYAVLLKSEIDLLNKLPDHYLYHDHLSEVNDPVYFHQFAARLPGHGLRFLGETRVSAMVPGNLGPDVEKGIKLLGANTVETEQFLDFVRNKSFRQSLLVKADRKPHYDVDPAHVQKLHAISNGKLGPGGVGDLSKAEPVTFRAPSGMVLTADRPLLRAAMAVVTEAWPQSVAFDDILAAARERVVAAGGTPPDPPTDAKDLAFGLLNCLFGSDLLDLRGSPVRCQTAVSAKPVARRYARFVAPRTGLVAGLRHQPCGLDPLQRRILPLLDGTRTAADIVDHLTHAALAGELRVQADRADVLDPGMIRQSLAGQVDTIIKQFAQNALLVA